MPDQLPTPAALADALCRAHPEFNHADLAIAILRRAVAIAEDQVRSHIKRPFRIHYAITVNQSDGDLQVPPVDVRVTVAAKDAPILCVDDEGVPAQDSSLIEYILGTADRYDLDIMDHVGKPASWLPAGWAAQHDAFGTCVARYADLFARAEFAADSSSGEGVITVHPLAPSESAHHHRDTSTVAPLPAALLLSPEQRAELRDLLAAHPSPVLAPLVGATQ